MRKPKSRFWSFIFALIPGCAQMYLGFMKRGLSLMAYFILPIVVGEIGNLGFIAILSLVVWAYSFFDALNLRALDPDTLAAMPDDLLVIGNGMQLNIKSDKLYKIGGIVLILIGVYSIWNMVFWSLYNNLYDFEPVIAELLYTVNNLVPRVAVSAVIIYLGIRLTRHKKEEIVIAEEPTDEFNEKP